MNESFLKTNPNIKGKVRLSVGEGLGVEIISKRLPEFYKDFPEIEIERIDERFTSKIARNFLNAYSDKQKIRRKKARN